MEIETFGYDITTVAEAIDLIDQLHSKAMEGCGAFDDANMTSPALDFMCKILDYAYSIESDFEE